MKGKIVYLLPNGDKLIYHKMSFYRNNEYIASLPFSGILLLLIRLRIVSRFLRLEPRSIGQLTETKFVVSILRKIWLLDLKTKSLEVLMINGEGWSNPLNFCSDGESLYWGDYGSNPYHLPVKIYRLDQDLKLTTVYQFSSNLIRHIHNILWDKERHHFFILTGDLESTSGIYLASADWKIVKPVKVGNQQYRAVVAFLYKEGLIYATDSVVNENHIYILNEGGIRKICKIPGSCIYGVEIKDYYVFSTTVEPPEGRNVLNMFSYKLGEGIVDRYSHVILVRKDNLCVDEIFKTRKDWLPMKLFQYGSIMFPQGQGNSKELWGYIMACHKDGHTIKIL